MSFYGTVYHQVVDAFHRILISNAGKKSTKYLSDNELKQENGINNAVNADGKNSIFGIFTGNHWIQLDIKKNENNNLTSIDIYHNKPHSTVKTKTTSNVYELSEEEQEQEGVINLGQGAIFSIPSSQYDTTGHLISGEEKKYKLPVTNLELDVSEIQKDVEELFEITTDLSNLTQSNLQTISSHENRLKTLENFNIDSRLTYIEEENGRLVNSVGDISSMYGEGTEVRDLSATIGSMRTLQTVFKDIPKITISRAIEENHDDIDKVANDLSVTNLVVTNHNDIIENLKARIEALEQK